MNEIQIIKRDGQAVVSSLEVAERFGKRHDHVMRDIENIIGGLPNSGDTPLFFKTTYVHEQNGQTYPMYLMNRDGFSLLAMGFTGKEALAWKLKYIEAFNRMEAHIQEIQALPIPESSAEQMRAEAMLKNAQTRQFEIIMKVIKDKKLTAIAEQIFGIKTVAQVVDSAPALPVLPPDASGNRLYTATEIGTELGVGRGIIGAIAIKNGLKTEEYGQYAESVNKRGEKYNYFRYNEKGRARLRELLSNKTA